MKNIIGILILWIGLVSFDLGSGTAYLKCKSESGRTEFYAELQDIEGLLEKAILKIDETELEYKTNEGHIIFDPKNGVLTMYIVDLENKEDYLSHQYIQFWSIPSTFKIVKNERHHQIYEFKAKIYGTEPRKQKEFNTPIITLNCRLEYEI
ncbi:hypothetical protein [Pseudofulvibacter geojedonensis]|uniref:Uncharacterized protein n=1 Tax=Pseudofulvibacter geojedonensis TaxID=1123758 RepID=A0ABW3I2J6_9FLAO